MAALVRCPVSYCGYPKRAETLDYDPRVGCNVFQCHACGVLFYAWREGNGQAMTWAVSPADGVRRPTQLVVR